MLYHRLQRLGPISAIRAFIDRGDLPELPSLRSREGDGTFTYLIRIRYTCTTIIAYKEPFLVL